MAVNRGAGRVIPSVVARALPLLAAVASVLASCGGRSAGGLLEEQSESLSGDGDGDDARECARPCGPGERCNEGVCEAEPCSQYQQRCQDNREEVCLDQEWVISAECPAGSTCRLDGAATYCEGGVEPICPPGTIWCDSEEILLICNHDGTEISATSCEGGARCVDGECRGSAPVICEPASLACAEGSVVRCSPDGTAWALDESCGPDEFCLEGEATCQARVCTPNAPFCIDNTPAQCNSVGSGYVSGMDCGSQACVGGACGTGDFYFEGFETGLSDWVDSGFNYEYSTTNLTFAGGASSLMISGGETYHYDGIYHQFLTGLTPVRVTYWARQDTFGSGTYFTLHDTDSEPALENEVLFVYFKDDGFLTVGSEGSSMARAWQPGVWYEISVTIDWPDHEFDLYVDGVLSLADVPFRGGNAANQVRRISLYHYDVSVGYWDSIAFE